MNEGLNVYLLNTICLRGRSPERVARTHQDGKRIADIVCGSQFITIRYYSEPTRTVKVAYNNVAFIESWDETIGKSEPVISAATESFIIKKRMGRPPKNREVNEPA